MRGTALRSLQDPVQVALSIPPRSRSAIGEPQSRCTCEEKAYPLAASKTWHPRGAPTRAQEGQNR